MKRLKKDTPHNKSIITLAYYQAFPIDSKVNFNFSNVLLSVNMKYCTFNKIEIDAFDDRELKFSAIILLFDLFLVRIRVLSVLIFSI